MRTLAVATMVVAAVAPGAALLAAPRDREPEVLVHEGKWLLDYDRDACHLVGVFGTGDAKVVARFTRYEQTDGFDLTLYGKRFRAFEPKTDAKIDFGSGPVPTVATFGRAGDMRLAIFTSLRLDSWRWKGDSDVAPRVMPGQEAQVKDVTVTIPRKAPFRLAVKSLAKPFAQMRDCTDNLIKSWGYDSAAQSALLRRVTPVNSPGDWLVPSDYPVGALQGGHNGLVQFRLDVDAEGKVAGCHVLYRTSPDSFADVTCRAVTRRARLQPALDGEGKPVRSYLVQKVRWQVASN